MGIIPIYHLIVPAVPVRISTSEVNCKIEAFLIFLLFSSHLFHLDMAKISYASLLGGVRL